MPSFADLALPLNFLLFAIAAAIVWLAGTRLARYADGISEATGLSQALLGLLLLAGVTSLPEAAVSLSSAWSGNAALAVNNLLGGIAMQIAFLAVADALIGRRALTSVVPDPVVMLQGALNIGLLAVVAAAIVTGDVALFGVGLWSWVIIGGTVLCFQQMARTRDRLPWLANLESAEAERTSQAAQQKANGTGSRSDLRTLLAKATVAGVLILVAGYVVSRSGDAIGEQTGLGSSFAGAVLLALATSLPEISTVVGAVRLGLYTMAISDILGTTVFNVGLLFAVDAVASGDPIFNRVGAFSAFAALLGVILTTIFVAGLAERRDRAILRMGYDSAAALIVYFLGLVLLYNLR